MTRARSYDNSARREAAQLTRTRILAAAASLLVADGYPGMSIAGLARAAGVSPQTVYNAVGGKAEVLKATYDVALAGDADDVPMSRRPEFLALHDSPDAASHARLYAALARHIAERVGPLLATVLDHAGADPALADFVATIERERRTGNGHMVAALAQRHGLPDGVGIEEVVDQVWVLTAPDLADRLIRRRGWSPDAYEAWLATHLAVAFTTGPVTERS